MSKIYTSVEQLIGKTPLLEMTNLEKEFGLKAKVLGKIESANPGGSAKDRIAKKMLDDAEAKGLLKPDSVIIEPTSGNTGIGLAAVSAARGYRLMIVMPDTMSEERKMLMKAYGAELVLTNGADGMDGAIKKAKALAAEISNSFIPDQFINPSNALAHFETTGPEIFSDTDGRVDCLVAGVGTGGTITGAGMYLKQQKPDIHVVGVEPATSAVLSGKTAGPHGLQGIGAGFIPDVLNIEVLDEVIAVTDEDAYETARLVGKKEGILIGISSGAAMWAALQLAKEEKYDGQTIVVILTDTGERYLSSGLFE